MFDLDEQVQRWRRLLADRLPGRGEAIDELESHLREAVERLMLSGKPPEQAWETALAQLGSTEQLAAEFGKLPAAAFYSWWPARVLLGAHVVFALWVGWLFISLAVRRHDTLLAIHVFSITVGYTAVFAIGAMAAWSIVARAVGGWTERETAALSSAVRWWTGGGLALTVMGVVLGGFWARSHMGRFWGWDIKEMAALGVLLWNGLVLGLLTWRPRDERIIMLLGQAGNVVVALCWFGPALLPVGLHSYGQVPTAVVSALLTGFVLIELALAGLTFVPPGRLSISRG